MSQRLRDHNGLSVDSTTESAAAVFSNTFMTSKCSHRRVDQPVSHASIGDLPTELLEIIFKLVCMKSRVPTLKERFRSLPGQSPPAVPYETMWKANQDLLSPSLFPYALASVCTTWRDVLSTIPDFWTRVVILIDTNPTPLPAIEAYLKWTHNLPLDVVAVRRPSTLEGLEDDPGENARVAAVVDLLRPHVHRCRSLQFDVIYSSSLPSLCRDFHGVAPELDELALRCRIDDGGNIPARTAEYREFICPVLQTLVVDGRNFMNSCMIDARPFMNAISIEISRFSPLEGESLSLYQTLETLQVFRDPTSLIIHDIDFDSVTGLADPARFRLGDTSLTFADLRGGVLAEIYRVAAPDPESTTITRCSVDPFEYGMWTYHLALGDIAADQDLTGILGGLYGRSLSLYDCPGFDDRVLAEMGQAGRDIGGFIARNIHELCISDCPNFSVGALKEMVKERHRIAVIHEDDDSWDDFSPNALSRIDILLVDGCGPLISPEDVEEFRTYVDCFQWCTILPDGRTCRVAGRAVQISSS